MRKNVASQIIGAQMITAADGTAFSASTVVAWVSGAGSTAVAGTTGAGVCAHLGNGFHVYNPAQSETNYDFVAFTFVATSAIPVTVQLYPRPITVANEALLNEGASGLVSSTCASGSTTTTIETNLTEATNSHYVGRTITFTSGALAGQSSDITGYNGTSKALTVTALTEAPANTDAFVIS